MPESKGKQNTTDTDSASQFTNSQIAGYLERIGLDALPETAPADVLGRLHVAHLLEVPFENLDIQANRDISLRPNDLYRKIVVGRRGGFCYELNELFRRLIESLGFDVKLVSSQVWMPDGTLSAPFDHAALLVELGTTWLADVGFGDSFMTPHPLGAEWTELTRRYRTVRITGGWRLEADEGNGWTPVYDLDPTPREIKEFAARCRWHETNPESFFKQAPLVSRATGNGRVTIMGSRFLLTTNGERTERELDGTPPMEDIRSYFEAPIVEQLQQIGVLPA